MDALQVIVNNLIEIGLSIICAVSARVIIPAVADYICNKTESQELKFVMDELERTSIKVVGEIEQTMVKQYKDEGNWNINSQKKALDAAAQNMLKRLSVKTTEIIQDHGVDIDDLVVSYIEARINEMKQPKLGGANDNT